MVQQSSASRKTCDSLENQRQAYKKVLARTRKFQVYLNEMCHVISNHAVKVAGLRDKNDELAKCLDSFTRVEEFSTTSKLAMAVAAELVATVGDHQDLAIQRIETMVLPNISSYGRICDCVKADVWNAIQAIKREKVKRKSANLLRKKSSDPKVKKAYDDALRELERASAETSRLCQLSREQVIKFEHKRLMDLKESLGNFLKIQIATHSKSLELLSQTFKHIQSIDEDGDLDILTSLLKLGNDEENNSKKKNTSAKGGKSNAKAKNEKGKGDSDSETSSSGYTTDSSHSEIVRHIEKVLKSSRQDSGDGGVTKKTSSKSIAKSETSHGNQKSNSSHHSGECKSPRKVSDVDIKKTHSSHSGHRVHDKYSNQSIANSTKSTPSSHKKVNDEAKNKKDEEDDYESDSYVIPSAKLNAMRGTKRPTTAARPKTVPTRMSSPEDLSSSRIDSDFQFRNKAGPAGLRKRSSKLGDYYYSMSEEDRTRSAMSVSKKQSNVISRDAVKHVSFKPYSLNPTGERQNVLYQAPPRPQTAKQYRTLPLDSTYDRRDTQVLFSPVKSSLKKYC